jgi:hypothetical protein
MALPGGTVESAAVAAVPNEHPAIAGSVPRFFSDQPESADRLRRSLQSAGYTTAGVRQAVGAEGLALLSRGEVAPVLRRAGIGSALGVLVRLFLVGVPVPRPAADGALSPVGVDHAEAAGLVRVEGDEVRGLVQLTPYDGAGTDQVVASDWWRPGVTTDRPDVVVGVGPASVTLANMTIRHPVEAVLDLGTGCGVQALHAAGQAARVVATDRNPRAVAFAGLTMALSGLARVDCRQGDLFEPVHGERFGLVVSNPPFVISPDSAFLYRDSGLPGDDLCRRLVAEVTGFLADGGWCQMLANWAQPEGADWRARVGGWFDGTGADAWVLQRDVQDVATYAATWIRQQPGDADRLDDTVGRWLEWYERQGIAAVGSGLITLRRTAGPDHWVRLDELTQDVAVPCGDDIARCFELLDWTARHGGDRELLSTPLRTSRKVRLRQHATLSDGVWGVERQELYFEAGLRYSGRVDPDGVDLLARCDGARPLAEALSGLAVKIGEDPATVTAIALPIVRRLVEQGFLLPPGLDEGGGPGPAGRRG